MSTEYHSSNPFRRKAINPLPPEGEALRSNDASAQQQRSPSIQSTASIGDMNLQTKPVKKVRVLSPPPSSPEGDSTHQELPIPIQPDKHLEEIEDPFEQPISDISNDSGEETETVKSAYTPVNPFQKTLATLEHTEGNPSSVPSPKSISAVKGAGRASLDVEAFKRLLMTGSADTVPPASNTVPSVTAVHTALHDGGSSTDASSSTSRQSIFETISELHPESPRTSHEVSDPDDEGRTYAADRLAPFERRKPPPPSSRHGKLIKIELKDEIPHSLQTKYGTGPKGPQLILASPVSTLSSRSPTDLNKPLPEAPSRASHESDRDCVFDNEPTGKTPEPPSPSSSIKRKTPPAPPLSRRHSQIVSDSKASRIIPGRLPSNFEEGRTDSENATPIIAQSSVAKAPPPPPIRRPASIRNSSTQDSVPLSISSSQEQEKLVSTSGSAPIPPPSRKQSIRQSGRPASVLSMDLTNKRASTAPPPPPPPRQRASSRTSTDGPVLSNTSSRRTSSDFYRRSTDSTRDDLTPTQLGQTDNPGDTYNANNILADLTALQKEVDAFRGQYEMRDVT